MFDLIVRRFLVCFASDAIRERVGADIKVGEHLFRMTGRRTLKAGWMSYYAKYTGIEDRSSRLSRRMMCSPVVEVDCTEKFELAPPRYNQSSLLEKMEREGIGTKATRAETISTLISRGYVSGDSLVATELGVSVVETMQEYCPQIVSTELTRETEAALEEVERGEDDGTALIERAIDLLSGQIERLKLNELEIGREDERLCGSDQHLPEHPRRLSRLQDREAQNHPVLQDQEEVRRLYELPDRVQGVGPAPAERDDKGHEPALQGLWMARGLCQGWKVSLEALRQHELPKQGGEETCSANFAEEKLGKDGELCRYHSEARDALKRAHESLGASLFRHVVARLLE